MHTASPYSISDSRLFRAERVTHRITRIWLPGNVFAYYVKGDVSGVLIDTGLGYGSLRSFLEEEENHLAFGQPYTVFLTHGHLDHAGGAGEFEKVFLSSSDFDLAKRHGDPDLRAEYLHENGVCHEIPDIRRKLLSPRPVSDFAPAEDHPVLDIGGETLRLLPLPGHTFGSCAVLFVLERILLTGDALNSWTLLFALPDSPPMAEYRAALLHLRGSCAGQYDRILYSHPHNIGGPEILDQMIDLTGNILSGKNTGSLPILRLGHPAVLAKPVNPKTLLRKDGGLANLVYDPDNLYVKAVSQ